MAVKADTEFQVKLGVKDEASAGINAAAKAADGAKPSFTELGASVIVLNQAFELAKKVYEAVIDPIAECTKAFIEQQAETYKLANSMAVVGDYSDGALKSFQAFAEELQNTANIDHGVAESLLGTAKLLGLNDTAAKKMVKTAASLAVAMGTNVKTAFEHLQAAQSGMVRGLARFAPQLKGLTEDQLKAGAATDLLAKRFGGLAEAATKSVAGTEQAVTLKLKDLKEEIGKLIVDIFDVPGANVRKVEFLNAVLEFFQNEIRPAVMEVKAQFMIFFDAVKDGLSAIDFKGLAEQFKYIGIAVGGLAAVFAVGAIAPFLIALATAVASFLALAAGITVVLLLGDLLYKNMSHLGDVAKFIGNGIMYTYNSLIAGMLELIQAGMDGLAKLVENIPGVGKGMAGLLKAGVAEISTELDGIYKRAVDTGTAAGEAWGKLDQGALGKLWSEGEKYLTKYKGTYDQLQKEKHPAGAMPSDVVAPKNQAKFSGFDPLSKEYQKTLEEMAKKNDDLNRAIKERSGTEIEAAKIERDNSLKNIADLTEQIRLHNMLSPEVQAKLNAQSEEVQQNFELKIADIPKTWQDYLDDFKDAGAVIGKGLSTTFGDSLPKAFDDAVNGNFSDAWSALMQSNFKEGGLLVGRGIVMTAKTIGQAVGSVLGDVLKGAMLALKGIFSGDWINQFADFIQNIGTIPEKLMGAFSHLDSTITSLVNNLPKMIEQFMQMIPKFMDSIMKAFPKLIDMFVAYAPKIVGMMADVGPKIIGMILDAIPKIIDIIPVLFDKLEHTLPVVIGKLMDALPEIIFSVFRAIPKIIHSILEVLIMVITTILDKIGPIIESIIEGLIGAIGDIVVDIVEQLLVKGGIEKIIGGILRAIPQIISAIIVGLWRGILALVAAIKRFFTGGKIEVPPEIKNFGKNFATAVQNGIKAVARDSSKLFAIKDLEQTFANANPAQALQDAVVQAMDGLSNEFANLLQMLLDAWRWLWDNILGPFCDMLRTLWLWVYDNIITPIINGLRDVWQWVYNNIIGPFIGIIQTAFTAVMNFFDRLSNIVYQAFAPIFNFFGGLGTQIWAAFTGVINWFSGSFFAIVNGAWSGVEAFLSRFQLPNWPTPGWLNTLLDGIHQLFNAPGWINDLKDLINKLSSINLGSIGGLGGGSGGGNIVTTATNALNPANWSTGGLVKPIYAAAGFTPQGTDTVPAMLTPGEMVVNREATMANLGALKLMNQSRQPVNQQPGGLQIGAITIAAKTNLDADSIRREVVPALLQEIKSRSQAGEYLMSSQGVRNYR